MLSTSFKGMEIPTYTDEEIKQKLSKDDMMDYVIGLDSMLYTNTYSLDLSQSTSASFSDSKYDISFSDNDFSLMNKKDLVA